MKDIWHIGRSSRRIEINDQNKLVVLHAFLERFQRIYQRNRDACVSPQ